MNRTLSVSLVAVLLALAGCGRDNQTASSSSAPSAAPAQSQSADAASSSDCPSVPSAASLAKAVDAAMAQIYGPDSVGTHYSVKDVQGHDCGHATFVYSVAGAAPQTAKADTQSDGAWHVTLYGKSYPVQ